MASAGKSGKGGGTNVTKKHLVDSIVAQTSLPRSDVQQVVQLVLNELIDAVRQGKRVELRDFGVFEVRARAGRTAQNPKTLEPVPVPPKLAVRFKAGRLMKSALEDRSREAMQSNGQTAPQADAPAAPLKTPAAHPQPAASSNGRASTARTADERDTPLVEFPHRQPASASGS